MYLHQVQGIDVPNKLLYIAESSVGSVCEVCLMYEQNEKEGETSAKLKLLE